MGFWWLEPSWKQAMCASCGVNIWDSGGDPDHGVCYECFMAEHAVQFAEQTPHCEICGHGQAVAGVNGYGVCSEICGREAEDRPATETMSARP